MKFVRVTLWLLLAVFVLILGAAALLYILADRQPFSYQPEKLTPQQSESAANDFINRKLFGELGNKIQKNQPFVWLLTQEQANRALASMDAIAFQLGAKAGQVTGQMERLGISSPVIEFRQDHLVVMAHVRRFEKVVSAELWPEQTLEGRFTMRIGQVWVGRLRVPSSLVKEQIGRLAAALRGSDAGTDTDSAEDGGTGTEPGSGTADSGPTGIARNFATVRSHHVGKVLGQALRAVSGQPVTPELVWPVNRKRVRITEVELTDGRLRLHIEPVTGPAATQMRP